MDPNQNCPVKVPESSVVVVEPAVNAMGLETLQSLFIHNVAHELRTPLTLVLGYAELVRDEQLGRLTPEQRQAMTIVVEHAAELRKIVSQVGTLMAARANLMCRMSVTLNHIVDQIVHERWLAGVQAGLTIEKELKPNLPPVWGDFDQLKLVVDCLLENAIKFTPVGGRVDVHTFSESDWVCVAVRDTGIGIKLDQLPWLFSGFYQAESSSNRRFRGIGLGLTLVKAVVEAHSGRIEVTSEPNQGSQFTIKLPVME